MSNRELRKWRQEDVVSFRELSGTRGHEACLPLFYWSLYCVLFMLFGRVVMKNQILHSLAVNVTPTSACFGLTPPVGTIQNALAHTYSLETTWAKRKLQSPETPVLPLLCHRTATQTYSENQDPWSLSSFEDAGQKLSYKVLLACKRL